MKYNHNEFKPDADESVLDLLLRNQQPVSYSCKSGHCQSCLLQSLEGQVDTVAQKGLKPTAIEQGFFLACQQKAALMQHIKSIDDHALFSHARLVEKHLCAEDVCRISLEPANSLFYHAGQFINLKNSQGVVRSYSLASLPWKNDLLELHIRLKPGGQMSQWIFDDFKVGDYVEFQGPIGSCFYASIEPARPLILIGNGTGAAPLLGIIRDALHSGHIGPIHFYHGSVNRESLYLHELLNSVQEEQSNVYYHPCVSEGPATGNIYLGRCQQLALSHVSSVKDGVFFLCGNPQMVAETRKKIYLAGVSLSNIYTDPFEYQDLRKSAR